MTDALRRFALGIAAFLALAPLPVFAASALPSTDFQGLVAFIIGLIQFIVPLLIAIALLVFFWGIIRYIFSAGSEDVETRGRETMLWGVIALFLMVSVWGILKIIASYFGIAA